MAASRYHIIVDVSNVSSDEALNNKQMLHKFLTGLPSSIGMSILDGPLVTNGIPENPGLSGFVLIDFSHISIHTFTKHRQALVDIFSCKPFEQENAVNEVLKYFGVSRSLAKIQIVSWH